MSSTNKTANLQLSQFLGTDKPAWLGDYNADMQKIDDGFAALKTGEATTATDIATLQQKDTQIDQDIKDTNDRIDSIATSDIQLGNRVTTLEGNYDTMHHELAVAQQDIEKLKFSDSNDLPFVTIYLDPVNGVDDDKRSGKANEPLKTFDYIRNRFRTGHLLLHLVGGTYNGDFFLNGYNEVDIYVDDDSIINGTLVSMGVIRINESGAHSLTITHANFYNYSIIVNVTISEKMYTYGYTVINNSSIGCLIARRCNINLSDVTLVGGKAYEDGKAMIAQGCNVRWTNINNDIRNKIHFDASTVLFADNWESRKTSNAFVHIVGSWVHMSQTVFDKVKAIGYDYPGSVLANKGIIDLTE